VVSALSTFIAFAVGMFVRVVAFHAQLITYVSLVRHRERTYGLFVPLLTPALSILTPSGVFGN